MTRLKIGFSALLMLVLLSVFAAATSAEDHVPTSTNPAPNINVGSVDNNGNLATHRTHGNFQNNTNSCANCHSTHNGSSATLLKFESAEFEMCLTCHDGTMGFYNVLGQGAGAGTFNDTHESASMHNVSSEISIGSAPGALANTVTDSLECSSCHNPHGSVNDRLLKEIVVGTTPFASYSVGGVKTPVPVGTKTIALDLQLDPAYKAINDITGAGFKITKSTGPKGATVVATNTNDKIHYSQFCSSCHDDYIQKSGVARADGHFTHTTNSSSAGRNCASCHFAHGTDVTLMKDTQGKTVADYVRDGTMTEEVAIEYMKDVSVGGSANKKYTNMAVCWTCHQTSKAIDTQQPDLKYTEMISGKPTFIGKKGIK